MAILVLYEKTYTDSQKMKTLKRYFDEFIFLEWVNDAKKYFVYKDGLPQDATQVEVSWREDENYLWQVVNVTIINRK